MQIDITVSKTTESIPHSAVQYFNLLNRHRINIDYEYLLIPKSKINIKNRF